MATSEPTNDATPQTGLSGGSARNDKLPDPQVPNDTAASSTTTTATSSAAATAETKPSTTSTTATTATTSTTPSHAVTAKAKTSSPPSVSRSPSRSASVHGLEANDNANADAGSGTEEDEFINNYDESESPPPRQRKPRKFAAKKGSPPHSVSPPPKRSTRKKPKPKTQTAKCKEKPRHPDKWDGTGNARQWINQLELYQELWGYSDSVLIREACSALTGNALDWVKPGISKMKSWVDFKKVFLNRFSADTEETDLARLMTLTQQPNETITQFWGRVNDQPAGSNDQTILRLLVFKKGMKAPVRHKYIGVPGITTMDQARTIAVELERACEEEEKSTDVDDITTKYQKLSASHDKMAAELAKSRDALKANSSAAIQCYICHQQGHTTRNCPHRPPPQVDMITTAVFCVTRLFAARSIGFKPPHQRRI
ncbi:hypothetical protein Pelo_4251 [Pelomyxa schiedti]|nr:hypothetical protein Pelo_4251 [Pelomyxa schiedti]